MPHAPAVLPSHNNNNLIVTDVFSCYTQLRTVFVFKMLVTVGNDGGRPNRIDQSYTNHFGPRTSFVSSSLSESVPFFWRRHAAVNQPAARAFVTLLYLKEKKKTNTQSNSEVSSESWVWTPPDVPFDFKQTFCHMLSSGALLSSSYFCFSQSSLKGRL